jgi:hypothetical protein
MIRTVAVRGLALVAGLVLLTSAVSARDFTQGSITIEDPWARATDKLAKTGAAYLMVKNKGAAPDKLVAVSADVAEIVELHRMVNKDGMMSMQHVDAVAIPAHGSAALKPGGYHVMFVNLKTPFTAGTTFPLQLTFEKAGKVTVEVTVQRPDGDHGSAGKDHGSVKKDGDKGMGGMKH